MKANDAKRLKEFGGRERPPEEAGREPGARHRHVARGRQGGILTPNRKRRAVTMLRGRFGVSERRACTTIGQPRSTQRLAPRIVSDDEQQLVDYLIKFSKQRPRWGWRRAAKQARRDGWDVNDKRVKRLWRLHGLRVPAKERKKRLSGIGTHIPLLGSQSRQ